MKCNILKWNESIVKYDIISYNMIQHSAVWNLSHYELIKVSKFDRKLFSIYLLFGVISCAACASCQLSLLLLTS